MPDANENRPINCVSCMKPWRFVPGMEGFFRPMQNGTTRPQVATSNARIRGLPLPFLLRSIAHMRAMATSPWAVKALETASAMAGLDVPSPISSW